MRQGHGRIGRGAFRNDNCGLGWHVGGMKLTIILIVLAILLYGAWTDKMRKW